MAEGCIQPQCSLSARFPKPVVLVQLPEFQKDPSIKDPNPAKLTLASDLKIQVLCFLSAT